MSSILMFAKLFMSLLLLVLPSSNCNEIRDEEQQEATKDYSSVMRCNVAGDAHQIQLRFNNSHGKVTPIDLDASYQSYVAVRNCSSQNIPILCTVTNYETSIFSAEIREVTRRTKATVLCSLPAKAATMRNESSSSYMSRHMYEISRQIANLIGDYQWLNPGTTVYEESESVTNLDIVTFSLNSHPTQNNAGSMSMIQMAATLSFSTSRPLHYYTELSIAVLVRSVPKQFVNTTASTDESTKTHITGFWIDVFRESATMLVNISYKLVPFYGSEDQLLEEVARKTFDAAVGLTVMTTKRSQLVDFSYPYFAIGPVMVMKKKTGLNQLFAFMTPFTNEMWLTMAFVTIFTAFAIWFVECTSGTDFPSTQVGALFCFSFATLFYGGGHRELPRKKLTYFVLGPWLLLILVVTSTYTASFTSMITTSTETDQPSSSCLYIEDLQKTNAIIGCDGDSILFRYIVEVLGFQPKNVKNISLSSIDDYAKALSSGDIKAAFFLTPYAHLFLAKYCQGFSAWNPYRGLSGSAVVFPRGSPLVSDMSEVMLRLVGSDKFQQMKKEMHTFPECSRSSRSVGGTGMTNKGGIGPGPFSGLFVLSGGASAIAMLITAIRLMKTRCESCIQRMLMGRGLWVWLITLFSQYHFHRRYQLELSTSSRSPTFQHTT